MTTVLVAGSGQLSQKEADDLLADFFESQDKDEIVLVVPGDRKRYTKAVHAVVNGFLWDEVLFVVPEGEKTSKDVSKESVVIEGPALLDVIRDGEEELDLVLIAVPDPEADDYEEVIELVEAATERGVPIKDLTSGLDDIRLEDDPEPESSPGLQEMIKKADEDVPEAVENTEPAQVPTVTLVDLQKAAEALSQGAHDLAVMISVFKENQLDPDPAEVDPEWVDAPAPEKRRMGRPRTNVGEKQIEREDGWVKRPRGRVKAGTPTRTVHIETGEILEVGVEGE